jgi:two-component system chemotaxis response regulator CheY
MLGNAHRDLRTLVVVESDIMRKLAREMLTLLGLHDVEEVSNAADALERLRTRKYGLVIADDEMSVMTGLDLLASMLEDKSLKSIPFVLMISDGLSDQDAIHDVPVSYLYKPFNVWDMKAAVVIALASV